MTPSRHGPVDAILVAGGHGRRAGGPKALRPAGSELAWRAQVAALRAAGCRQVAAVLHPDAWLPHYAPAAADGALVVVADPDRPMLASLQRAIAALADPGAALDPAVAVAVLPVDCPMPQPSVLAALVAAWFACPGAAVVRPCVVVDGRSRAGHPLLLSAAALSAIAALDGENDRLDHWIAAQRADVAGGRVLDVAVDDGGILANFNVDAPPLGA